MTTSTLTPNIVNSDFVREFIDSAEITNRATWPYNAKRYTRLWTLPQDIRGKYLHYLAYRKESGGHEGWFLLYKDGGPYGIERIPVISPTAEQALRMLEILISPSPSEPMEVVDSKPVSIDKKHIVIPGAPIKIGMRAFYEGSGNMWDGDRHRGPCTVLGYDFIDKAWIINPDGEHRRPNLVSVHPERLKPILPNMTLNVDGTWTLEGYAMYRIAVVRGDSECNWFCKDRPEACSNRIFLDPNSAAIDLWKCMNGVLS